MPAHVDKFWHRSWKAATKCNHQGAPDCVNRQNVVNTAEAKFANVWKVTNPVSSWTKLSILEIANVLKQRANWPKLGKQTNKSWRLASLAARVWIPDQRRANWELGSSSFTSESLFLFYPQNVIVSTWKDPLHLSGVVDDPVPWLDDALEHLGLPCLLLPPRLNVTSSDAFNHPRITILLPHSRRGS